MHSLLWGFLPPSFVQFILDKKELLEEAVKAIDSMVRAYVSEQTHVWNNNRIRNEENAERFSLFQCPQPSASPVEYEQRFSRVAVTCNYHRHHITCRKGKTGKYGCRSFMPSPICQATGPAELSFEINNGKISNVRRKEGISPQPQRDGI